MTHTVDPSSAPSPRVAVVTGGASGIGPALGRHLAREGYHVALLDRQGDLVRAEADKLRADGAHAIAVEIDVTDRDGVIAAIENVRRQLGPISAIVTSAGVDVGTPVAVTDITAEQWDRLIAINLTGTFTCIQAALPDMQVAGWGRIGICQGG